MALVTGLLIGSAVIGAYTSIKSSQAQRRAMGANASLLRDRANMLHEQSQVVKKQKRKQFDKLRGTQAARFATLDGATRESIVQDTEDRLIEELIEVQRSADMQISGLYGEANNLDSAASAKKSLEPLIAISAALGAAGKIASAGASNPSLTGGPGGGSSAPAMQGNEI